MTNPAWAGDQPGDARGLPAHVATVRPQVSQRRHAASLPLLLLGAVTVAGELPQVASGGGPGIGLFSGDWFTGLLLTAAFAVLWLTYRRRALRDGPWSPAGFGAAAILGLVLLTVGFALLAIMGPFILLGLGLLIAGWRQRNTLLTCWAVLAGGVGVFEGFFGITNRLPLSVWHDWEHPAIYLTLGIATILAGVAAFVREDRGR